MSLLRRFVPAATAALLALSPARADREAGWEKIPGCTVLENTSNDGDSFHVRAKGRETIFRLYFVDTPEVHDVSPRKSRTTEQARYWCIKKSVLAGLAAEATRFSHAALAAGPFTVLTRWEDARGASQLPRFFAVIQSNRGDLAELLVANGLARIHGHYLDHPAGTSAAAYQARLKTLEARARAARLGAWGGDTAPAAPRAAPAEAEGSDPVSDIPAF